MSIQVLKTVRNLVKDKCSPDVFEKLVNVIKDKNAKVLTDLCKQIEQGDDLNECLPLLEMVDDFDQVISSKKRDTLLMRSLIHNKNEDLQLYLIEKTKIADNSSHVHYILTSLIYSDSKKVQSALHESVPVSVEDNSDIHSFILSLKCSSPENVQLSLIENAHHLDFIDVNGNNIIKNLLPSKDVTTPVILALIEKFEVKLSDIMLAIEHKHEKEVLIAMHNKMIIQLNKEDTPVIINN